MRRAQIDSTSQTLVRNIAGNPGFNYASGTQTVRTNLCSYPSMEGGNGTPTIRTNLALDPKGVFNTSGYGTQTITPNVAITGHPEGITTATRVAYAGGAANPGLVILNPTTSGTQYTMSAWVYHETIPASGTQAFAEAGVSSMPSPPAFVQGVWQRFSWTKTSTGSAFGFRVSSQAEAGSFLITGVVVEATSAVSPYFDGGTPAAVRTNLALNPQPVVSTGWSVNSSSGGVYTATLETTGSPVGQNFRRMVCTSAPSTWARHIVSGPIPAVPGTPKTASAYFRLNRAATNAWIGIIWYNQAGGQISEFSTTFSVAADTWTRGNFTATAPATAYSMQVYVGLTANVVVGDQLDGAGLLVEEGSAVGTYFDGATSAGNGTSYGWRGTANASISYATSQDLSYSWTGTANNSTSIQKAVTGVAGWSPATLSALYQSSASPQIGTKCAAVFTKGGNGDGTFTNDISVTAGASYTWSAWVKITEAVPNLSASVRWKDSAQNILRDDNTSIQGLLVVGSWVRVSATSVAPTGATLAQCMWRIFATHTGTTFYIDGAMLEQSPVLTPYFDGTNAASGDYTYAWSGAGHVSQSTERTPVIPQIIASKSSSIPDAKFFAWQSTAEDGVKTCKFFSPKGTASSSWRVAQISGSSTVGWDVSRVKAGQRYTLWMRYRSSGWGAGQTFNIQIADGTSLNPVITNEPSNIPLNATGWVEYSRSFTAIRDATAASQIYMALQVLPQVATDGIFEIREWMLVEGDYTGDYFDGNKQFSKWDGTVNQSSSTAYPPQRLELIAGAPEIDITTASSLVLPDNYTTIEGRTLYTVFQNIQDIPDNQVYVVVTYGNSTTTDTVPNSYLTLRQEQANGAMNLIKTRKSGGGGPNNQTISQGVHVTAWGMNPDGTLFTQSDNGVEATDPQVMSVLHQKITVVADTAFHKHHRTIMFRGKHDAATRAAIQRYLGNKYGANVA